MKIIIATISLFLSSSLFAQNASTGIRVSKDARIDSLIKKQIEINELTTRDARRVIQGYRILVMNTQDRQEALQAKSLVYQQFPDHIPYMVYQSPYFKVKIGNFVNSEDAEAIIPAIKSLFPKGVFVVKDLVEVNPDKSHALNQP